jgi:hypothetical protein
MRETDASAELRTIAIGAALTGAPEGAPEGADCDSATGMALASPSMNASRAANLTDLDIMKYTCTKDSGKERPWFT